MAAPKFLLAAIAVGYPNIGPVITQHLLGDTACPARGDLVQHRLVRDEHPVPLEDAVHPGGRLVRSDNPGGAQLLADGAGSARHVLFQAPEDVGDGALRDGQAEHLGGEPRQPLEADMVAMVEVGQQRADAGTKWRARCHPHWRRAPVAPATPTAAAAEQLHPRHHRPDRRQVDMVVAVPAALRCARHVRPAVTAGSGDDALGPLDRLGTGLSGVSANGRVLPSRDGRGLLDALSALALPRPNPSFEGGTCELLDVLQGARPAPQAPSPARPAARSDPAAAPAARPSRRHST